MAHIRMDLDSKTCTYEIELGDKFEFFKIEIIEDNKNLFALINQYEAELLVVALNQYIDKKKPRKQ